MLSPDWGVLEPWNFPDSRLESFRVLNHTARLESFRALKLSNLEVIFRTLELSNLLSFRALKLSKLGSFRALKLSNLVVSFRTLKLTNLESFRALKLYNLVMKIFKLWKGHHKIGPKTLQSGDGIYLITFSISFILFSIPFPFISSTSYWIYANF